MAYILSFAVLVLCSACFWFWWLVGVAILSKNEITFLFDIYFIVSVLVIVWFIALSKLCCLQVSRKLQARLGGAIIVFIPLMKLQVVFPQILCSLLKLLKSSLTYFWDEGFDDDGDDDIKQYIIIIGLKIYLQLSWDWSVWTFVFCWIVKLMCLSVFNEHQTLLSAKNILMQFDFIIQIALRDILRLFSNWTVMICVYFDTKLITIFGFAVVLLWWNSTIRSSCSLSTMFYFIKISHSRLWNSFCILHAGFCPKNNVAADMLHLERSIV